MLKNVSVDHGNSSVIKYAIPIVLAVVFLIFIGVPAFEISSKTKIDLCHEGKYYKYGIRHDYIEFHPIPRIIATIFVILTIISYILSWSKLDRLLDRLPLLMMLMVWEFFTNIVAPIFVIVSGELEGIELDSAIAWINNMFFFISIWTVLVLVTRNIVFSSLIFILTSHLSIFGLPGIKWSYMIPILFASIGYAVGEPLGRWMERRIEIREMRERIRREEERRRKEYEQKMKEFKLKLKRWKEEGYDVSELEEMLK